MTWLSLYPFHKRYCSPSESLKVITIAARCIHSVFSRLYDLFNKGRVYPAVLHAIDERIEGYCLVVVMSEVCVLCHPVYWFF